MADWRQRDKSRCDPHFGGGCRSDAAGQPVSPARPPSRGREFRPPVWGLHSPMADDKGRGLRHKPAIAVTLSRPQPRMKLKQFAILSLFACAVAIGRAQEVKL